MTISCVSASRRTRDRSSLISDNGTSFIPGLRIVRAMTWPPIWPRRQDFDARAGNIVEPTLFPLWEHAIIRHEGRCSKRAHRILGQAPGGKGSARTLAHFGESGALDLDR